MKTSLYEPFFKFSLAFAAAARIFSTRQLASHPFISGCSQPVTRAQQFLWAHGDTFEKTRGAGDSPWLWRLTTAAKRKYGYTFKSIAGDTQRRAHWLGLGDLWLALTYAGGRPTHWTTEPHAQFDVDFTWNGKRVLAEYQRSELSPKRWKEKWDKRLAWYEAQKFDDEPYVLLIVTTEQSDAAIKAPEGTYVCRDVRDVPRTIQRMR
ncbi:hypothetical protein [Alicyclobacillus fastidiosus]|uniref:DUF4143 domain-containing protein n=1 Tax=Alicyclobacillus fastidiosus TaxID=392011 RepID=A0ABV5AI99_9BACL|nr:hypothetical protein [Alicyclobacillus fastidiosus]WEH11121.1 hypothetical protein PYS47_07855 [Alicyclobacillus fastidiosus]